MDDEKVLGEEEPVHGQVPPPVHLTEHEALELAAVGWARVVFAPVLASWKISTLDLCAPFSEKLLFISLLVGHHKHLLVIKHGPFIVFH